METTDLGKPDEGFRFPWERLKSMTERNGEVIVKLTEEQASEGDRDGALRHKEHEDAGRFDTKVRAQDSGLEIHQQGARAELAVALAFGMEWTGRCVKLDEWFEWRFKVRDVSGVAVRSTHHRNGRLCIHKIDPDKTPFVLVITEDHYTYRIAGWLWAYKAKKEKYWADSLPRPCYAVPQRDLRPIPQLLEGLRKLHASKL